MATLTPDASTTGDSLLVAIDRIHIPPNVRELDLEWVDALAGSIELEGLTSPVEVTPADPTIAQGRYDYVLVFGFHRIAAVKKLGWPQIKAQPLLDHDKEQSHRALENIARKQLDPYEEAVALRSMLEKGYSHAAAATALGWSQQLVAARVKLLELPEQAQRLTGRGTIPLAAVDTLRDIGQVSPGLLDTLVAHIAAEPDGYAARQLTHDPSRAVGEALRNSQSKQFAAFMTAVNARDIASLRLGKKTEQLLEQATKLNNEVHRYSYGPPTIRFNELDIDQARAHGVLIEFEHGAPVITDRPLFRELCKQAVKRTVEELTATLAQRAADKRSRPKSTAVDPAAEAGREQRRKLREIAAQAHGANLDLGWSLRKQLGVVDPADINVARFFVLALIGRDYSPTSYSYDKDNLAAELALRGVRLVVEEFRADETKTLKNGAKGALRIAYGNGQDATDPVKWLWRYLDAAKTAGELYGRALVVIAAERYASRLVLPASQQRDPKRWPSHQDRALKALEKLAAPHVPATLKQIEKAVKQANAEHEASLTATSTSGPPADVDESDIDIDIDNGESEFDDAGDELDIEICS